MFAATSCSKPKTVDRTDSSPKPLAAPAKVTHDVCALLTTEEIEAVQGEAFKNTKASEKSASGLLAGQCYFELPTASNSIVLTVTRKAEGGRDPSESWKEIFHRETPREKKEEGEEKEKEAQKVEGIGDEAFWTGTRVGGAGDQAQKLEKSKRLAESALKRL